MINFSIITPSFKRFSFIKKTAKNVSAQTYQDYVWHVIHDGPNQEYSDFFSRQLDPRVRFHQLESTIGDWGYAPRLKGLQLCDKTESSYCVLWDDDNYYPPTVLEDFALDLKKNQFPDYLIAQIVHANACMPDFVATVEDIGPNQIDTACLIMKAQVALTHFTKIGSPGKNRGQDVTLFHSLRADKNLRGVVSQRKPLIIYDGARPLQNLRWRLGIPRLGLANLKFYRNIRAILRR